MFLMHQPCWEAYVILAATAEDICVKHTVQALSMYRRKHIKSKHVGLDLLQPESLTGADAGCQHNGKQQQHLLYLLQQMRRLGLVHSTLLQSTCIQPSWHWLTHSRHTVVGRLTLRAYLRHTARVLGWAVTTMVVSGRLYLANKRCCFTV